MAHSIINSGGLQELVETNYQDRWYNGVSYPDRLQLSLPQREERYSRGNNPMVCCMTGFTRPSDPKGAGYLFTHLEDYHNPLDWYPMSKRAHYLLHRRFIDPKPWLRLVAKHYRHGAWFTFLTMDVKAMYQPFKQIYPDGLPKQNDSWEDYADERGITAQKFQQTTDGTSS